MSFLLKKNIHNILSEIFFSNIFNRRSNWYYYIGKVIDWSNPNIPDTPVDTGSYEYETRNNIINVKRIQPSDVSYVITRRNWTSNVVYDQYDPEYSSDFLSDSGASSLSQASFYVLSAHQGGYYNLYKCLFNNNAALSVDRPSGSDPIPITYNDGYVWKYMYTIPLNLRNKFLTQDYIPVSKTVLNQYYSNGEINSVVVDNRGSGYSNNAQVTLSVSCEFLGNPGNISANLKPILNESGQFIDIIVNEKGNNIKSANIIISDSSNQGESYYKQANSVVISNFGDGYTSAAIANTSAQVVSTGTQPNANATIALTFSSDKLNRIEIVNGGFGYTEAIASNTAIVISTSGAVQPTSNAAANVFFNVDADFHPIIINGKLEDVLIKDPGINYSTNSETIVSIIGDGVGAKLSPYVNESGEVESIIIEQRGFGYTYLDIDIIGNGSGANAYADFSVGDLNTLQSTVELSAIDGAVYAFRMIDRGDGYTVANVTLQGDGRDFVGNCIIENNTISKIDVINPGRNYTFANVIITGNGSNARATAIMSPVGGHGFDSVKELCSDTVMLYSTITNDKIQGIEVNNDYRQFGLIRDIEKFNTKDVFANTSGSACYLVSLNDVNDLEKDTKLVLSNNANVSFHVVAIENEQVLLTDNSNYPLTSELSLVDRSSNISYTILTVDANPNINKFSGDLITIDNRTSTAYSDQQTVTLKSVIKL